MKVKELKKILDLLEDNDDVIVLDSDDRYTSFKHIDNFNWGKTFDNSFFEDERALRKFSEGKDWDYGQRVVGLTLLKQEA